MKKFLFFLLIALIYSRPPNRAPPTNTSLFDQWLSGLETYLQDTYKRLEDKELFLKIKKDLVDGGFGQKAINDAKLHCKKDYGFVSHCEDFVDVYNEFLKNQ